MNDRDIYTKTEAGREEMRTRALRLSGAMRGILLLVDGHRTVAQLQEVIAQGKAPADALTQLATMLLIEELAAPSRATAPVERASVPAPAAAVKIPIAEPQLPATPPSSPPAPPPADAPAPAAIVDAAPDAVTARFNHLYTLMNEIVSDYLGLRGYFMQMKIERCSNAEDLVSLIHDLGVALTKAHGKEVATELVARLRAAAA